MLVSCCEFCWKIKVKFCIDLFVGGIGLGVVLRVLFGFRLVVLRVSVVVVSVWCWVVWGVEVEGCFVIVLFMLVIVVCVGGGGL